MTEVTKAVNLTEDEVKRLINYYGYSGELENKLERVNYFSKRLKAFSEPETKEEAKQPAPQAEAAPAPATWGANA